MMSTTGKSMVFLALTFALSWGAAIGGWALGAANRLEGTLVSLMLMMTGPAIAALVCAFSFEKGRRLAFGRDHRRPPLVADGRNVEKIEQLERDVGLQQRIWLALVEHAAAKLREPLLLECRRGQRRVELLVSHGAPRATARPMTPACRAVHALPLLAPRTDRHEDRHAGCRAPAAWRAAPDSPIRTRHPPAAAT